MLVATALIRNVGLIAPHNLPRLDEARLASTPMVPVVGITAIAVLEYPLFCQGKPFDRSGCRTYT
jgi:hypothetical protein